MKPHKDPMFDALPVPDGPTLVERVRQTLVRAIIEGRLGLGERLIEAEYARQMGISRAPLREAARLLEQRGLLTTSPGRGFFVRNYSLRELDNLYGLRICLEQFAVDLALQHASDQDLQAVPRQLARMADAAARNARYELVAEDIQLHRILCELGGNQRLVRTFDDLAVDLAILLSRLGDLESDPQTLIDSHGDFVAALMARDPARARLEIARHIDGAWRELRDRIDLLQLRPVVG